MQVINDEAMLELIVNDIIDNYEIDRTTAYNIARDQGGHIVEQMWAEYDSTLEHLMHVILKEYDEQ